MIQTATKNDKCHHKGKNDHRSSEPNKCLVFPSAEIILHKSFAAKKKIAREVKDNTLTSL